MQVARNVLIDPYLLPGGGAAEMAVAHVRMQFYLPFFISMLRRFSTRRHRELQVSSNGHIVLSAKHLKYFLVH